MRIYRGIWVDRKSNYFKFVRWGWGGGGLFRAHRPAPSVGALLIRLVRRRVSAADAAGVPWSRSSTHCREHAQGDLERAGGMDVSPLCDRLTQSRVDVQVAARSQNVWTALELSLGAPATELTGSRALLSSAYKAAYFSAVRSRTRSR